MPLENFTGDKNVEFILSYLKEHYNFVENSILQSVELMNLCNGKSNYKIFLKNDLQIVKFIVYYEENFRRVMQVRSFPFEMAGLYDTLATDTLLQDPYFRAVDKFLKEAHSEITEGSSVVHAEKRDVNTDYSYRVIYANKGKTFHSSAKIHKELQDITEEFWNEIIEIPTIKTDPLYESREKFTVLKINDLARNSNFENVHREILSQFGSFLQNAQMLGSKQKTSLFRVEYEFFFLINGDYYKVEAELDSATQRITIASEPQKISLSTGYSYVMDPSSNDAIQWVQNSNPDLHSGVVMEIGRKSELFGTMYKVIFKMPTKFVTVIVMKEGGEFKELSQDDSTTLAGASAEVAGFPRPGFSSKAVLNI